MIEIIDSPIDTNRMLAQTQSPLSGAVVLFLGTTRQYTDKRETAELQYECYEAMALKVLKQLRDQAIAKWNLHGCALVHRIGTVPVGEASVAVAVSSAHRSAAFEAAEWLMNRLKEDVPIWKQERFADGTTEWIHPG